MLYTFTYYTLYAGNNKTLLKDIKENLNIWRDMLYSQIERFNIVKISMLPKLVHIFRTVKVKILFFKKCDNLSLKYLWKSNGQSITKRLLKRSCKVGELAHSNVKHF